jgi:hypothetical protein
MTDSIEPAAPKLEAPQFNSPEWLAQRDKVIRQRNLALALVLVFFVVLFFAITIVKMKH